MRLYPITSIIVSTNFSGFDGARYKNQNLSFLTHQETFLEYFMFDLMNYCVSNQNYY